MTIPTNPAPNEEWTNDATGITYVWDGSRWSVVPNEPVELPDYVLETVFEADQERQDTAHDEFKEESRAADQELEGSINQIDEEQSVQNSQINALETQLQLLAQTQAVGKWTYERNITTSIRPPATAKFYGTDVNGPTTNVLTNWSNLALLMIDKTDIDGTVYTFADFEEGDKIEVLATDGSSACYGTVTNNPTNDSYGNLVVAVERSNGGPSEGKEYLISVFRPGANTGDVDLDILDSRYLVKTGDTMTGNLVLDTATLNTNSLIKSTRTSGYAFQVYDEESDANPAFIHSNGNIRGAQGVFTDNVEIRGDTLFKGNIDTEGNLSFSNGGTIDVTSGNPVLSGRASLDIRTASDYPVVISSGSGYKKVLAFYGYDGSADDNRTEVAYINANGNAYFNTVYANDEELATKTYVDNNAGGNVNLDNYVQKTGSIMTGQLTINTGSGSNALRIQQSGTNKFRIYPSTGEGRIEVYSGQVFKMISTVNGSQAQILKVYDDGEQRLFHLKDPSSAQDAVNQRWAIHNGMRWTHANHEVAENLSSGQFFISSSNGHIYMHGVSADGIDIRPNTTATEEGELKFFVSVHNSFGGSAYMITTNKISFNNGSNNYIRIEKLHGHKDDATVSGQKYRLNIPGITY